MVGLGVGWRLAATGCTVDLFDQGEAGHGASWAAAGMLAAGIETELSASLERWEHLERLSGG